MFKIPRIEKSQFYIDLCMKSMSEFAQKERDKIDKRFKNTISTKRKTMEDVNLNKRKDLELEKIRHLNFQINQQLKKLIKRYPDFRKVDEIYLKLINTSDVRVSKIQDDLSILKWICSATDELTQNTCYKIKKARTSQTMGFLMKKYLGKVNSYYRKNKSSFTNLQEAAKFMNQMPNFEDLYTMVIAGFPNVGKSTLMKKITGSNVEIKDYPFTTKGLMFGYIKEKDKKVIQLIDTPGLLGRQKENQIEQRAQLIIQGYSSEIIFVLDFTQKCGFSIENQLKLLKETSNSTKKNIILYLSKTDIFDEEVEEKFEELKNKIKKFKQFKDSNILKYHILETHKKSLPKFDPKKIGKI